MNITIEQASKLMNKSQQFIRTGLQRGLLPIGYAQKNGNKYSYYISPKLFEEYTGIKVQKKENSTTDNETNSL